MGSIFQKAQQEKMVENLQTLLDSVKGLPEGSQERAEAYIGALERLVAEMKKEEYQRAIWDFSREKAQPVFAQNEILMLRPAKESDADFYVAVRMQYSMMYRTMVYVDKHSSESLFQLDLGHPESFYCIIESPEQVPVGYLGIKDTRKDIWELAIELDKQYTQRRLGPQSIVLFLNEISRITGKTTFNAWVEADNIPSQECFERIGAAFIGLCDGPLLKTPEEKEQFEGKNLNLIDDNIRNLADRLGVEPRKLLSHVLDYRLTCPL